MNSTQYPRWSLKGKIAFERGTHLRREDASYYVTGDDMAGHTGSWFYLSTDKIHQMLVEVPVLKGWRWSEAWRPISHADTIYIVLEGALMLNNPETGEAHRVLPGEAVYFLQNTWYFGLSIGDVPLKILEYIGPEPPAPAVAPHAYPPVDSARFFQDEWLGRWPAAQAEAQRGQALRVVRDADSLWRLEGPDGAMPVALFMSTPHLTAGKVRLLPGQMSDIHAHGGDEALYLPAGNLKVRLADHAGPQWSHLGPGDGYYVPQGAPHQYYNSTAAAVEFYFGVAPAYLPDR